MGLLQWIGVATPGRPLELGDVAPDLTANDESGCPLHLDDIYHSGYTLIFFFPRADTPGCTAEVCSLRDAFADLQMQKVLIAGVSADSPERLRRFKEKNRLPFPLLSDENRHISEAFGVPTILGMTHRQSFLIRDRKIVWRDLRASTRWQARDVLAALAALPRT
jgi:peroxiredoxin Q/BCP